MKGYPVICLCFCLSAIVYPGWIGETWAVAVNLKVERQAVANETCPSGAKDIILRCVDPVLRGPWCEEATDDMTCLQSYKTKCSDLPSLHSRILDAAIQFFQEKIASDCA